MGLDPFSPIFYSLIQNNFGPNFGVGTGLRVGAPFLGNPGSVIANVKQRYRTTLNPLLNRLEKGGLHGMYEHVKHISRKRRLQCCAN